MSATDPSVQPVYRAEVCETDSGWFWRVEVDVRNGRAWSGYAESFAEAAKQAAAKLRSIDVEGTLPRA